MFIQSGQRKVPVQNGLQLTNPGVRASLGRSYTATLGGLRSGRVSCEVGCGEMVGKSQESQPLAVSLAVQRPPSRAGIALPCAGEMADLLGSALAWPFSRAFYCISVNGSHACM